MRSGSVISFHLEERLEMCLSPFFQNLNRVNLEIPLLLREGQVLPLLLARD